ncbi:guanylyl and adenylyl cyclase family member [Haematococcus lacustris]|uniref:Guanylyl and adenylyl cyclase family member n=1 Tax=Haematococcus lacustris TaxID=44745 RepID=A0A6A0A5L6_HAELA|nr:guanylyl and adenylyl cyclase family member [Haematococcus lacustris]
MVLAQAMVSVTEVAGNIILQNAASTAAFGMQGRSHRAEGDPPGFNLLQELFGTTSPLALEGKMFSKVVKITSPVLRHWLLPTSSDADIWHQVQISRARDPTTMDFMYVVAQVDVTSAVLTEHKVNELQAENLDLHLTTAWLEDQKRKADEINER